MKPSDELFKLIKSLTKSEKRFFKLSSSLQSGEKNYLKLFDAIEKQLEYDEEDIKNTFKKENFIKHLPSEKNHLYKLVLKSLRAYHADNSVVSQLQEDIKNVEILFKRALYREAGKVLSKSKKLAYAYERFYFLFELIKWEKQLLEEEYKAGNFQQNLDELITEEKDVLEKLRNLAEYRILYSKINYVFRKGGYARNDEERAIVEDIRNYHLIKGKNTAQSKSAAATCYYIQGLCAIVNHDYSSSYEKFTKVVSIFEENPKLITEIPHQYIKSMSNLLYCFLDVKDFDSFFDLLGKIRALENQPGFKSIDIKMKLFTSTYTAELVAYDYMGEYEKGIEVVDDIVAGIDKYKDKISKEEEILFYYNIAYVFFGANFLKNALRWLNKVINDNESNLRQDVYSFARLFSLVIHYELENYDLLDYMVKSTSRFYQKRRKEFGREYKFETIFIKYIKKLAKSSDNRDKQTILFANLKTEMQLVLTENYEKVALNYFDFSSWVDSKIENRSFMEVKSELSKQKTTLIS